MKKKFSVDQIVSVQKPRVAEQALDKALLQDVLRKKL